MALYLGNDKIKINLDGVVYCLNLVASTFNKNYIALLSSDNFILRDSNGLYLLPVDAEIPVIDGTMMLTLDDYILQDINGLYLTTKESE